jgi:hypothetical protein
MVRGTPAVDETKCYVFELQERLHLLQHAWWVFFPCWLLLLLLLLHAPGCKKLDSNKNPYTVRLQIPAATSQRLSSPHHHYTPSSICNINPSAACLSATPTHLHALADCSPLAAAAVDHHVAEPACNQAAHQAPKLQA